MWPQKAEGDGSPTRAEFRQMLRALLAERFNLKAHYDWKEIRVYALVVGKNGPKFKESAPDTTLKGLFGVDGRNQTIAMPRETMAALANDIGNVYFVDRPVVDRTDLHGTYDIKLEATPEFRIERNPQPEDISVFTAIQDQLGLKLEQPRPMSGSWSSIMWRRFQKISGVALRERRKGEAMNKQSSLRLIEKPREGEYPAYAHIYIDLLPDDGLILKHLADNFVETRRFVESIPQDRLLYRYAEGKWTIKEILGHVVDDERIYAYRALRFARNDATELPGFDQDDYARYSEANRREVEDLLDELGLVRHSTIALFESLDEAALLRSGVADGKRVSVRALAYHIAGHELRHRNVIRERYLT